MARPEDVPGEWSARERHQRALACCDSEPPCVLCPLREENARRSLKELAQAGLYPAREHR